LPHTIQSLLRDELAAITVSGGFFGVAFNPGFRWLLYFGATCLVVVVVLTGVGRLRRATSPG
jgi:hypothetical protein